MHCDAWDWIREATACLILGSDVILDVRLTDLVMGEQVTRVIPDSSLDEVLPLPQTALSSTVPILITPSKREPSQGVGKRDP